MNAKTRRLLGWLLGIALAVILVIIGVSSCGSDSGSGTAASTPSTSTPTHTIPSVPSTPPASGDSGVSPDAEADGHIDVDLECPDGSPGIDLFGVENAPESPGFMEMFWKFGLPDYSSWNMALWIIFFVGCLFAFVFFLTASRLGKATPTNIVAKILKKIMGWGDWSRSLAVVCVVVAAIQLLSRIFVAMGYSQGFDSALPLAIVDFLPMFNAVAIFFLPAFAATAWIKVQNGKVILFSLIGSLGCLAGFSATVGELVPARYKGETNATMQAGMWLIPHQNCQLQADFTVDPCTCQKGAGMHLVPEVLVPYWIGEMGPQFYLAKPNPDSVLEFEVVSQCVRPDERPWWDRAFDPYFVEAECYGAVERQLIEQVKKPAPVTHSGTEWINSAAGLPEVGVNDTATCSTDDGPCAKIVSGVVRFALCNPTSVGVGKSFTMVVDGKSGSSANVTALPFYRPRTVPSGAVFSLQSGVDFDYVLGGASVTSKQLGDQCPVGTIARISGATPEAAKLDTAAPQNWR